MTTHPIDTEALAKRAGYILFADGPEQPAATARETCVLLDLLADAEYRAGKAEEQVSEEKHLRMKATAAATEAEARVEAAQEKAWEECAATAAHHGDFDGSRTRWLSSINPYSITEKETA